MYVNKIFFVNNLFAYYFRFQSFSFPSMNEVYQPWRTTLHLFAFGNSSVGMASHLIVYSFSYYTIGIHLDSHLVQSRWWCLKFQHHFRLFLIKQQAVNVKCHFSLIRCFKHFDYMLEIVLTQVDFLFRS